MSLCLGQFRLMSFLVHLMEPWWGTGIKIRGSCLHIANTITGLFHTRSCGAEPSDTYSRSAVEVATTVQILTSKRRLLLLQRRKYIWMYTCSYFGIQHNQSYRKQSVTKFIGNCAIKWYPMTPFLACSAESKAAQLAFAYTERGFQLHMPYLGVISSWDTFNFLGSSCTMIHQTYCLHTEQWLFQLPLQSWQALTQYSKSS